MLPSVHDRAQSRVARQSHHARLPPSPRFLPPKPSPSAPHARHADHEAARHASAPAFRRAQHQRHPSPPSRRPAFANRPGHANPRQNFLGSPCAFNPAFRGKEFFVPPGKPAQLHQRRTAHRVKSRDEGCAAYFRANQKRRAQHPMVPIKQMNRFDFQGLRKQQRQRHQECRAPRRQCRGEFFDLPQDRKPPEQLPQSRQHAPQKALNQP